MKMVLLLFLSFILRRDGLSHAGPCDKDTEISIHLVNGFVRLSPRKARPMLVVRELEEIQAKYQCDPNWLSFFQYREVAANLGFGQLSAADLWTMIHTAEKEHLDSLVLAEPGRALELYAAAVAKRPTDAGIRFDFGKALAIAGREADAAGARCTCVSFVRWLGGGWCVLTGSPWNRLRPLNG